VTIVRVGTTQVYSEGWEGAFGKGKKSPAASKGKAAKPAVKKGKKKAKK
jgi:hypothetical protein